MPIQSRTIILPRSRRPLTYELERKTVKNLNLRVRIDGTAHLSIPKTATVAAAEAFLCSREEWILSALARMEKRAEVLRKTEETGDSLPYLGGTLAVVWRAGTPARVEAHPEEGRLVVTLPDPNDTDMRAAAIETFEKAETTRIMGALVDRYYPLFAPRGVPYPKAIRVKAMKTRFGSCSSEKGYLNFASSLCRYPLAFAEYVAVHELCHFLEANHSDRFRREVARVLPDWEARERLGKPHS